MENGKQVIFYVVHHASHRLFSLLSNSKVVSGLQAQFIGLVFGFDVGGHPAGVRRTDVPVGQGRAPGPVVVAVHHVQAQSVAMSLLEAEVSS